MYNLYGSTEVAYGTLASPADLRASPNTAGRPLRDTTIEIHDKNDRAGTDGARGRIFVSNPMLFGGYTDGGTKQVTGRLMSAGDLGYLDEKGRLFVEGHEDDMIVSGGENVFPEEVEHLLLEHAGVTDTAVIGVPNSEYGTRSRPTLSRLPERRRRRTISAPMSANTWHATRSPATSNSSTRSPGTPPASSSAASCTAQTHPSEKPRSHREDTSLSTRNPRRSTRNRSCLAPAADERAPGAGHAACGRPPHCGSGRRVTIGWGISVERLIQICLHTAKDLRVAVTNNVGIVGGLRSELRPVDRLAAAHRHLGGEWQGWQEWWGDPERYAEEQRPGVDRSRSSPRCWAIRWRVANTMTTS